MRIQMFIVAFAMCVGAAFTGSAMAKDETLSGTVTYLNRSMLPPNAVLDVALLDISRADAASITLSSRRYKIDGVPFSYELTYDSKLIDDRFSYAISATISVAKKVLYRTTTHYPALTRDAPDQVDVVVELSPKPSGANLAGKWEVSEITGRLLITDKHPLFSFLPDGLVGIDSGCNTFRGTVEISGSSIVFSDKMAGTLKACLPPYDKLEKDILAVLPQVAGWVRTGDRLALTNQAGVTVLRLNGDK